MHIWVISAYPHETAYSATAWPTLVETAVQVREGRYAYKYRPNMDCQWLITAPTEKDKVEQA